jgi:hypothetical protein
MTKNEKRYCARSRDEEQAGKFLQRSYSIFFPGGGIFLSTVYICETLFRQHPEILFIAEVWTLKALQQLRYPISSDLRPLAGWNFLQALGPKQPETSNCLRLLAVTDLDLSKVSTDSSWVDEGPLHMDCTIGCSDFLILVLSTHP